MTLTIDQARTRAARGARLLDRIWPRWARAIRLRKLDMHAGLIRSNGCGCVLAQLSAASGNLEPSYTDGMMQVQDRRGIDRWRGFNRAAAYFGFVVRRETWEESKAAYDVLTEAWKDEIRTRR